MALSITTKNYDIKRGDTLESGTITVTVENQPSFNWTGVTVKVGIRSSKGTSIKEITPTPDLGTAGALKFSWSLSATETKVLTPQETYKYDAEYTLTDGTVKTVVEGGVMIYQDYTYV